MNISKILLFVVASSLALSTFARSGVVRDSGETSEESATSGSILTPEVTTED